MYMCMDIHTGICLLSKRRQGALPTQTLKDSDFKDPLFLSPPLAPRPRPAPRVINYKQSARTVLITVSFSAHHRINNIFKRYILYATLDRELGGSDLLDVTLKAFWSG